MGFVFKRNKTILRKRILLSASKMAKRLSKVSIIAKKQAQSMLSRIGWFKHTNTKYAFDKYILQKISISSLKDIISRNDRRRNNTYELLEIRNPFPQAIRV